MAAVTPLNLNTPELAIRQAMANAFLLEKGSNPTSEDYATYMPVLNGMIQFWITQGLKLFLWKDTPLTMVAVSCARCSALVNISPIGKRKSRMRCAVSTA